MSTAEVAQLQAQVAELSAQIADLHRTSLTQTSADTFWLIFSGSLVFFMQCGFGMLEAGAVASKSTESIMMKNLFDAAIAGLLWWLVGYGITNEGGNPFMGISPVGNRTLSHFATHEQMESDSVSGVDWATVFFQYTFAAAAATIVSGAVAERAQLSAYLIFSSMITGFVYPVVAHWVWSTSGWLSFTNDDAWMPMIDFAGSGVVHMTGGISAFCGAFVIGPRTGRFDTSGQAVPMPGHSSVLQVLGTFILWLGWYGFNAGSTLGISTEQARIAGHAVVTTTLSATMGGITCVCWERFLGRTRTWEVSAMCNGILSGLVSITAGCATVMPWSALVIGLIGGLVYRTASRFTLHTCKVDDPLDAFAVHGACGCWGVLACALFTTPEFARGVTDGQVTGGGLFYGDASLLGAASVFILAHAAWVGTLSYVMFFSLKQLAILRFPLHVEMATHTSKDMGDHDASTHGGQPFWPPASAATAHVTDGLPTALTATTFASAASSSEAEGGAQAGMAPGRTV